MRFFAVLLLTGWAAFALPAFAQSPLPDVVRSAGVTQAQWDAIQREARTQAQGALEAYQQTGNARLAERMRALLAQLPAE